jgi:hypothetical protein
MNSSKTNDICLSSEDQQRSIVKKLYSKLKNEHKLRVKWLNKEETIDRRCLINDVKNSSLFLCCISKSYVESKESMNEILMAKELNKKGIIVYLDPIIIANIDVLHFTTKWRQFNFHEYKHLSGIWEREETEDLIKAIGTDLNLKEIKVKQKKTCCY